MKKYAQFAILAGLVVGLASLPSFAVRGPHGSPAAPAQEGSSKTAPAAPKKASPKEEKDYKNFYETPTTQPQAVVKSGKAFLKKYPDSSYAASVYTRLTAAYEAVGDQENMLDAGHKALQLNPDEVDVLSTLAYAIPRRVDPNNLDSAQQLQEASQYAHHALELLPKMPKPSNLTQDQFTQAINAESASCHSGLGLVDYYQHNIPGMVSELEQAVKLNPTPDASDQFLLGLAYIQAGRPADAEDILQKCIAEPGPLVDRCKSALGQAQKLAASHPKP